METLPLRVTVEGVLTRTVRDTAAFFYGAEQHFTNSALPAIGEVRHPVKERLRVGVFVNKFDGSRCEHEVENATLSVAELCQNLGHFVEEIDCPFSPRLVDDFTHYWAFLGFAIYWFGKTSLGDEYLRKYTEPWTRALAKRATRQLWKLPLVLSRLRKFEAQYQQIFQKYDVLLSPTLGTTPPVLGHLGPDVEFETAYERLQNFAPFTLFQNAAGAPAISLPLARSQAGLPIGVQFASGVGRERMLLELAYELEQASPWDHLSMNL
jgi:amidase